jgi:protein involved in polysaccharide export with SLBB domain
MALEDGDRFVVPRVPSTVAVEGQVYSANAFVFVRGRRERDYLRQAGGPDRNADKKRTFILRADGSVYSRQYGDVDRASIFPGDTIVVPPNFSSRAFLRDLVDISNVVGGLGIGVAAINLLR